MLVPITIGLAFGLTTGLIAHRMLRKPQPLKMDVYAWRHPIGLADHRPTGIWVRPE